MSSLLSIIIVNYRTPQLLKDCLQTIYRQSATLSFEVIIVDNDSGDDSEVIVRSAYPGIRWIQMSYNSGFARANNEGIRQSAGDTVLLLNSDTLNEGNAIDDCYRSFLSSHYAACGVQLLNADRTPQISGSYFMTGSLNNLLPLPLTGSLIKWLGSKLKVNKPHVANAVSEVEVDWINGAFLMVKKSSIAVAGLMDEDFFLYAEEAEWCARLKKAGKLAIYGQYKVIHLQGESANATFNTTDKGYYNLYDKKGLQIMLSNFVRIRKQWGSGWFLFHLIVYTFTIPVYFLLTGIRHVAGSKNAAGRPVSGFTANVLMLWKYGFRIISNKPFFYKVL